MADSKKDKIKYSLLKAIDFSSFTVLDPVVRLIFKEDTKKQARDIGKYMITPIVFVLCCVMIWAIAAPRHKTKSGEVPGPSEVLNAASINSRFHEREQEKERDTLLSGKAREEAIAQVKINIQKYEKLAAEKAAFAKSVEDEVKAQTDAKIAPLKSSLDVILAKQKEQKAQRKVALEELSQKVLNNEATSEQIIALVREDNDAKESNKLETKDLKTQLDDIRSNPPKRLNKARLVANKAAEELQHQKKRLDQLTTGNRYEKVEAFQSKYKEAADKINTADTPAAVLSAAKNAVRNEKSSERAEKQVYAKSATVWWQAMRSIFTVIIGFFIACVIAIPIGMLCGLNRVFMACMTPLISIFRPVSPVVWLLIFQIVIGAFFLPSPEEHGLFKFFNSPLNPFEFLQVNPAMVFSACTVAICAMWPALVNTALGVSSVDRDHMNVAKVLRLGFWSRLFKIIIPSSLPLMFAGLRISLGVGWMVLIAAEALSSSDGLGKFVWDEYQNGSSHSFANIILACFIVGIIGFVLDRIMIMLQKLVTFDDGSATV